MEEARAREEIDKLTADFFSAFDNRNGSPEIANILACFADKAVIARSSGSNTDLYTVMEFALPRIELLTRGALVNFHESEISSTTSIFGGIAIRTSRYSKTGLLNGDHYGGVGTKCFQFVALDRGWRIASLAWVDDDT
jgi:hypothetical protein